MKKLFSSIFAILLALNLYTSVDNGIHSEFTSSTIQPAGDDLIEGNTKKNQMSVLNFSQGRGGQVTVTPSFKTKASKAAEILLNGLRNLGMVDEDFRVELIIEPT